MDGLPDNLVSSVLQDQEGFIWIGTSGGLCRFDGHEFQTYYYDQNNPKSVCGNNIKDLALHSDGTLWIGTGDGGLCSLGKDRKTFVRHISQTLYRRSVNINCLLFNKDESKIYIGMENAGLHFLDLKTGIIESAVPEEKSNKSSVYDIMEDSEGQIYFGQSSSGIQRLKNGIIEKSDLSLAFPHPAYAISCFFQDSSKNIWMGAWSDRLFKLNSFNKEPEEFAMYGNKEPNLSGNEIICINEGQDKKLWLGTKLGGLFIFDPVTNLFNNYGSNRSNPLSLKGYTVRCIFKDKDNRMWVGSEEGLNIYDPLLNKFSVNYLSDENNCKVFSFLQEGDSLFIGTEKGLYLKHANGSVTRHTLDRFFNSEEVRSLFRDHKGRLWIGTQNGLYHWNNKTKNVDLIPNQAHPTIKHNNISSSYVTKILEYPMQGKLCVWAFILGYGCLVFPDDIKSYAFVPSSDQSLENLVRNVYIDSHNKMWVTGTILGASIVMPFTKTPNSSSAEILTLDPISAKRIGVTNAFDMIDVQGKIWFGFRGRGIVNLPLNENDAPIKVPNLIPKNIQGLNADLSGNIWFLSALGIGKYSTDNNTIRFFDSGSGVPTEGLAGLIYSDKKNRLYCGGNGFYIRFNPNEIKSNLEVSKLIFTHFQVMDQQSDSLLLLPGIYLNHNENSIKITVTSLNFTNPSENEYIYKLVGLYEEWISNGTNNVISFTGLPPGEYKLSVLSKNGEGIMSQNASLLNFTISRPFYRTWLFYTLLLLIISGVAYAFYRNRVRQLMAIIKVRNKIARDLHDDVGSTLGSISIYSEAIKQQLKGSMSEFSESTLDKIGTSSRLMIEQMSDIVWSVDPQHDTMEHLVERMQNFGGDLFATTDIHFTLEVEKECFSKKLDMEERKSIFLIYKEALYNSLKYSGGNEIKVTLKNISSEINLRISDNGRGFNPENALSYNGNGLRNMTFRAQNIGATIQIKSEDGWGTDITLILK